MAPRTLATLATVLSAARDADAALTLLQHETVDIERSSQLVLFICDSRRQLIIERLSPVGDVVARTPLNVSIDHLPAPIRRALNSGSTVADFGAESDDYMKLLGVSPQQQGGILSVRGLTLDGELAGFVALYDGDTLAYLRGSERAVVCFERAGASRLACGLRVSVGFALLTLGRYEESELALRDVLVQAARMGLATQVTLAKHNLGSCIVERKGVDQGRHLA